MPADIVTKYAIDVLTDVKRTFGDESAVQITDSDIMRWINNAQLEVAMRNPEILPAVVVINGVQGQGDYPLVANVPDVLTIQSLHYKNKPLEFMTFQEAEINLKKGDSVQPMSGDPIFWYERAGVITLYPAPPDSNTGIIKVYYQKKPAAITNTSALLALPDHYYNAIVDYCMEQATLLDENAELASIFGAKFDQGVTRLQNRTQAQSDFYPFPTVPQDGPYYDW